MKKTASAKHDDDLRDEYDLSQLEGAIRGKYYRQALAGSNLVLIEPELAAPFPDSASVNRSAPARRSCASFNHAEDSRPLSADT